MCALDDPALAARVSGQSCVVIGLIGAGAHGLTHREALRLAGRARHRRPACQHRRHRRRIQPAGYWDGSLQRLSLTKFRGVDGAALQRQSFERGQPNLVVGEIGIIREGLARRSAVVDTPEAGGPHRERQRQNARFPGRVKQLAHGLGQHWAWIGAAPEIGVRSITHTPLPGGSAKPVPIMESRVTRFARSASSRWALPSGRRGITRYRTSAVESQTRIPTLSGRLTPKSSSTLRGSRTARERYGALLYQVGGNPSTAQG